MPSTALTDNSLLLGELLGDAADATATDRAADIPQGIAREVRGLIARRWRVRSEDVVLRWGETPTAEGINGKARVRLVGRGEDGWFVVVYRNPGQAGSALRLRAGVSERIPVAAHSLTVGCVIQEEDILFSRQIHWGPVEDQSEHNVQPGWQVRTPIIKGGYLRRPVVAPRRVVSEGDIVRLRWKRGVVSVALEGIALHDAGIGEHIRVKLSGGRGMSAGIVDGPGEVRLDA